MSDVLIRYNISSSSGFGVHRGRYIVFSTSQPYYPSCTIIPDEIIQACKDDAAAHNEQFNTMDYVSPCPIRIDKAIAVSFRLEYDQHGTIKRRKLTVSRSPRTLVSECFHYSSSPDVRIAYKFLVREAGWLRWWGDEVYPNRQSVVTGRDSITVVESKRDKYGLTTIRINVVYNAEGMDKSQYRVKAQDLVQAELDKLSVELFTGHSLLQNSKDFSEV